MNKIIGLVGEDPNDTSSVKNLLQQKFMDGFIYKTLLKNFKGSDLDNERTNELLLDEYKDIKPDIIIFIRDVDGIVTQKDKRKEREDWYIRTSKGISKEKKILLLNIAELEALLFADVDTLNKEYKINIKGVGNVSLIEKPKEKLRELTNRTNQYGKKPKKYEVAHCPELFKKINIEVVIKNCKYFNDFITKFSKII